MDDDVTWLSVGVSHSQRSVFKYCCVRAGVRHYPLLPVSLCLSAVCLRVSVSELVPLLVPVLDLELVRRRRERLGLDLHSLRFLFELTQLLSSLQSHLQTDRQTDRHAYGHRHTVRDTAQHYISLHNYMHSCSEFQWSKLSQNHQNVPNWDSNSSKICSRVVDLFACYWPYIFTIAWLHYRSIRSDTHGAFWRSTISYNDNTWHFSLELSDKHTQP